MYSYFKNQSTSAALEPSYKNKIEDLALTSPAHSPKPNHSPQLWVEFSRIENMLGQRHVQLLGRSVDLTFLLTQHINAKLRGDVEFAVSRFESSDARGIVDLRTLIDILSDTHRRISRHLPLDPFPVMLDAVNHRDPRAGSNPNPSPGASGRIARHFCRSLEQDIAPNFSYNASSQRFVPSPIAMRPVFEDGRKPPRHAAVGQVYGPHYGKAFELSSKLTRSITLHRKAFMR